MHNPIWKRRSIWLLLSVLLGTAALATLFLALGRAPVPVAAHAGDPFGPACGEATMDGVLSPGEWDAAARQTFQMTSLSGTPFTTTLYVMNNYTYLYLGLTIDDDEFSPSGEFLPVGDGFRIDFDNDHSGTLFALLDDVLSINAGGSQFYDNHNTGATSADEDLLYGGTSDGDGAASRVGELSHFELRHPLCSGDTLDFCLHPTDTVGFRLEYFDAQGDGSFGGSQYYPGFQDTSEADIVIGQCAPSDLYLYLPVVGK